MKRKALSLVLCLTILLTMMQGIAITAWVDTEAETSIGVPAGTDIESDISGFDGHDDSISDEVYNVKAVQTEKSGEPVLAYVPLDNRPVNADRVIYEAESAGFTVMMPDADLYATRLDGQPLNSNGTQFGDGQKLLNRLFCHFSRPAPFGRPG